jgi:hypothetical protein
LQLLLRSSDKTLGGSELPVGLPPDMLAPLLSALVMAFVIGALLEGNLTATGSGARRRSTNAAR